MTEYFRQGGWAVTSTRVETPRADFDIGSIRAVEINRMPLIVTLAVSAAALGSSWALSPILYPSEILVIVLTALVAVTVSTQVGCMRVSGSGWRGTETGRFWGWVRTLRKVRQAIRRAQEAARTIEEE